MGTSALSAETLMLAGIGMTYDTASSSSFQKSRYWPLSYVTVWAVTTA